MNQLIDVIVPTMNRFEYLEFCLNSIINQTYKKFIIHVLDNNSNDGTKDLIKRLNDNRIIFYESKKKLSLEENWARANDLIKNDFFVRIDDDNIIREDFFENALNKLKQYNADAITFNQEIIGNNSQKQLMFYDCGNCFSLTDLDLFYFTYNNLIDSNYTIYRTKTLINTFQNNIYLSDLPDRFLDYRLVPLLKNNKIKFLYHTSIGGTTCFRAYNNVKKFNYVKFGVNNFEKKINFKSLSENILLKAFHQYDDKKYLNFYSNYFKNSSDILVFISQLQDFKINRTLISDILNAIIDFPKVILFIIFKKQIVYHGKSKIYAIIDIIKSYRNLFLFKKTLKGYTKPNIIFRKNFKEVTYKYDFGQVRKKINKVELK